MLSAVMSYRFRPKQSAGGHILPEAEREVREFVPQGHNAPRFQSALDYLVRVEPLEPRGENESEEDEK